MLGSHHILVARTEDLEDLGHRLCAVGHSADSLNATSLENLADASHTGCYEDGGIHLALAVGRRAEYYLTASGNLGRRGQHEDGREEWGGASRDIQSNFLDSDTLLPAGHTLTRLNLMALELLGSMELMDVFMSQHDGGFQFLTNQALGLVDFSLCDSQRCEHGMVEALFIFLHGFVTPCAHIAEHGIHRGLQLRDVQMWTLADFCPFFFCWITVYPHDIVYRSVANFSLFTIHFSLLKDHFFNRRDQDALSTQFLQLSDDLPETLLVEHGVY